MFNPEAVVRGVPLFDGHEGLVIDDALVDPKAWVDAAVSQRARFAPSPYAYPGVECALAPEVLAALADFFAARVRTRLHARRTLSATARLSLATKQPHELLARQWFCHRDSQGLPPDQCTIACVIYLFGDESLGGTSIYRPRRGAHDSAWLVHESCTLSNEKFAGRHPEIRPGYMIESNDWFERVATIPARFNRAVFYDGGLFHSADLRHPERLTDDPATGRLTVNGFFTCRRRAA